MRRIITAILCAAAVCACNGSTVTEEEPVGFQDRFDIALTRSQQELVDAGNSFAFDFLRAIHPAEQEQEVFISPFSLQAAFSMLANGAAGDTYSQMASAIGYGGAEVRDINSAYGTLISALHAVDNSTRFSVANALWLAERFPAKPDFVSALQDFYGARVENLDFSSPDACRTINSWAEEKTFGMIPELLDHTDPAWAYVLTNALYFKGVWSHKFESEQTRKDDFIREDGSKVRLDFMHGDIRCRYAYSDRLSAAVCELPFGNGAFVLDAVLPDDGIDFDSFIQKVDSGVWNSVLERLIPGEVFVILPRIDISYSGKDCVREALKSLGMKDAFEPNRADFSRVSDIPTYISEVIHKARFKMDESGAEAAAVTAVIAAPASVGPGREFFADHPFLFAIREISTGAILFLGTYRAK